MSLCEGFVGRCDLCHEIVAQHENEERCLREFAQRTKAVDLWGNQVTAVGLPHLETTRIRIRVCKNCIDKGNVWNVPRGAFYQWQGAF